MISSLSKRFGFKFENIIFAKPFDVPNCDQSQIISYKNIKTNHFKVIYKTPIIKFDQPIEKIFSNFNKTTRNEINRSKTIDELKIQTDSKDFKKFYKLYLKFEEDKKRLNQIPKLENLKKQSKLFLAKYKNKIISAILCYDDQKILRANVICSLRLRSNDPELRKIISFSTRRLMFEICNYGIKNNYKFFDLGEINEDPKSKVYPITQFKLNFGGELVDSIHYYKIYNPLLKILALIFRRKYF